MKAKILSIIFVLGFFFVLRRCLESRHRKRCKESIKQLFVGNEGGNERLAQCSS